MADGKLDLGPVIKQSVAAKENAQRIASQAREGAESLARQPLDFSGIATPQAPSGFDAFLPLFLGAMASSTGGNPLFGQAAVQRQQGAVAEEQRGAAEQRQAETAALLEQKRTINDLQREALQQKYAAAKDAGDFEQQLKVLDLQKKLTDENTVLKARLDRSNAELEHGFRLQEDAARGAIQKQIAEIGAGKASTGNKALDMQIRISTAESNLMEPFVQAAARLKMPVEKYFQKNPSIQKKLEAQINGIRAAEVASPAPGDSPQDYLNKLGIVYGEAGRETARRLFKKAFPSEPFEVAAPGSGSAAPAAPVGLTPLQVGGRALGGYLGATPFGQAGTGVLDFLRYLNTPLPSSAGGGGGNF